MMERTVLFYDFHRQYRMPRSQNVLRLGQNRSLGPTGPNTLDGLCHVHIGKFADILGADDIDDAVGIAFDLRGALDTTTNAGDDDVAACGGIGLLGCDLRMRDSRDYEQR